MTEQYLRHSREILTSEYTLFKGGSKEVPLISLFGYQNQYDLRKGFPLLTTKRMAWKSAVHETLWFMRGETNIKYLVDNGVPIWNRDAFNHNLGGMVKEGIFPAGLEKYSPDWKKALGEYEQEVKEDADFANRWGGLGPVYGAQWRRWRSVGEDGKVVETDQFANVIESLKEKPTSKKILLTAWNPGELPNMALPPCHLLFQPYSDGEVLDLEMYQRSCDQFLGVPFNVIQYAFITHVLGQETGLEPRRFVHTFGDSHFYCGTGERGEWYGENLKRFQDMVRSVKDPSDYFNVLEDLKKELPREPFVKNERDSYDHVTAILEQLAREPKELPRINISRKPFNELTIDDIEFDGYNSHPTIRRAMAV